MPDIGDWVNYTVGGACILSVILLLAFRGRLNRSDEDDIPRLSRARVVV
jgi:hypothetical protein